MALDNLLEVYDENGVKQDYDILADDVKFSPDGKDLPTKLAEMQQSIDEAGQVNEIVMNGENYTPKGKVIDLGTVITQHQDISGKVDKEQGKGLSTNDYTTAEKDKLDALPTSTELDTQLGEKADKTTTYTRTETDVAIADAVEGLGVGTVQSVSVNGGTPSMPDQNGNVNINVQDGGLTKEDISVETQGDGIVDINVADDTYKINLNHTHENMAKLVVCEESDLPSTLDPATIYAQVDDAADPTEIQSLWIAGLEFVGGGGEPEPKLRFPSPNSQINVDDLISGGLFVRGYNLSQPLLVKVTGDFTVNGGSTATVQTADANAGTTLTLACTTQSYNATGSLVITSSEGINTSCSLIANVPNYESITAAVFRGAQWVNMGFSVGPNTSFEWDVKFEEDSQHAGSNQTFFSCNSDSPYLFQANFDSSAISSMLFWVGSDSVRKSGFSLGRGTFIYANQNCSYRGLSFSPSEVTFTANDFSLGISRISNGIFNRLAMIVFGLKVYENNVLTHDFVPKKFGSVVGFYDNVTSAFVSSQTSTELEEYNS